MIMNASMTVVFDFPVCAHELDGEAHTTRGHDERCAVALGNAIL